MNSDLLTFGELEGVAEVGTNERIVPFHITINGIAIVFFGG